MPALQAAEQAEFEPEPIVRANFVVVELRRMEGTHACRRDEDILPDAFMCGREHRIVRHTFKNEAGGEHIKRGGHDSRAVDGDEVSRRRQAVANNAEKVPGIQIGRTGDVGIERPQLNDVVALSGIPGLSEEAPAVSDDDADSWIIKGGDDRRV